MRFLCIVLLSTVLSTTAMAADIRVGKQAYSEGDYDTAFAIYQEEARNGDPGAQFLLALMYRDGKGTKVDMEEALNWQLLAAA